MAVAVGCAPGGGGGGGGGGAQAPAECLLRDRLPQLWRNIESAHYSYLETDDSPEKLQQRKKLEGYITEYLSLVPHECKFGLSETGRVFTRTVAELPDFSAYRAGQGWAALARYAANLLAQPWRKEYRTIRLYCGYYKHEVEANLVSAELLLGVMGYRAVGAGRVELDGPVCPDLVAAVSRDALVAYVECQMMCEVWERVWRGRGGAAWAQVARERARRAGDVAATVARLTRTDCAAGSEIYSNVKPNGMLEDYRSQVPDLAISTPNPMSCSRLPPLEHRLPPPEEPIHPTYVPLPPTHIPHNLIYTMGPHDANRYNLEMTAPCNPMMNPYGIVPGFYYAPVQAPYVVPAQVYAPIKQAATIPVNGYPQIHRHPAVPTGQLIELEPPSDYMSEDVPDGRLRHSREDSKTFREDSRSHRDGGKYYREDKERHKKTHDHSQHEDHRTSSLNKATWSDASISRSDTQPALGAARDDGTGTYESWDYVFRNLSNREYDNGRNRRSSPPPERDSRTLERLERDDRRRFQPATLDLEDGLNALSLDRSYDDEIYRTAKVNENLLKMKQDSELKKAKALAKKQLAEEREKKVRKPIEQPVIDIETMNPKIAPDKVRLISKKDAKDKKDIQKQCTNGYVNGSRPESKTVKKIVKSLSSEAEKPVKLKPSSENGMQTLVCGAKGTSGTSGPHKDQNGLRERGTQLVVSLEGARPASGTWECGTCTFVNAGARGVCEMCGKSRRAGPEAAPLTSGGRECPACTLVNRRDARACDACATSLDHSPTYI